MALFCDASCLVKFTRKQGAHIVKYAPYNYDFQSQEGFITACAFPELSDHADSIFVSSISHSNCFTWSFTSNYEQYSIILITHHMLAEAFLQFLTDCKRILDTKDTNSLFDIIWNYLLSWTYNSADSILTMYTPAFNLPVEKASSLPTNQTQSKPSSCFPKSQLFEDPKYPGKFEIKLDNSVIVYSSFDPAIYLGSDNEIDYIKLWHALLTNKSILVITDTPTESSNAVFSIISLAAPLMYCEEYLAYTRLGDPRFAEIVNGSTRWKIIGTTNVLAAERCKQFAVVLNLSRTKSFSSIQSTSKISFSKNSILSAVNLSSLFPLSHSQPPVDVRKPIKKFEIKLLQKLEDIFNEGLESDPYSDFLQYPLHKDEIERYFHHHTAISFASNTLQVEKPNSNDSNGNSDNKSKQKSCQLSVSEVLEFQKTETFRAWRGNIACRDAFRDAVLSIMPEYVVYNRTVRELNTILQLIPQIKKVYKNDEHLKAVLKMHKKWAKKELKYLEEEEEEEEERNES